MSFFFFFVRCQYFMLIWHDLQGLIKRKKFISSAYSAIESRLSFASSAKAFADQAVSRGTEVPSTTLDYL